MVKNMSHCQHIISCFIGTLQILSRVHHNISLSQLLLFNCISDWFVRQGASVLLMKFKLDLDELEATTGHLRLKVYYTQITKMNLIDQSSKICDKWIHISKIFQANILIIFFTVHNLQLTIEMLCLNDLNNFMIHIKLQKN